MAAIATTRGDIAINDGFGNSPQSPCEEVHERWGHWSHGHAFCFGNSSEVVSFENDDRQAIIQQLKRT